MAMTMKNYEFFEQKYLDKHEFELDKDTRSALVHLRRMDSDKEYEKAIEARLYRQENWEEQWRKLGLK